MNKVKGMNNDVLGMWTQNAAPAVETMRKMNQLWVGAVEKIVALNLASVQTHTKMVIDNLKTGAEIADVDTARGYLLDQGDVAKTMNEQLRKNYEGFAAIGKEFTTAVSKLAQEGVKTVGAKAA